MLINEVAASLYPWDVADEGIERIADNLQGRSKVNCMYLVGVMHHEKRPLTSLFYVHNPARKFYIPENSRVYYHMDLDSFRNTRLKPCFTERDFLKKKDWLDVLTQEARRRGMRSGVELSHTIFDTELAYQKFPDMLQRNVLGEIIHPLHGYLLCPNNEDVREYQRAMFVDTVKNHDVDIVQTCMTTFASTNDSGDTRAPWYFDKWMDASKPALAPLFQLAAGGCFCDCCRAKAIAWGYDWDLIVHDMKRFYYMANATAWRYQEEVMENNLTLGSNLSDAMLLIEYPGLMEFLKFRIQSITELFEGIYRSVHEVKPNIEFRYNNYMPYPEYTGLSFKHIAPFVDSIRDSDYSEQTGAKDHFERKRHTLLKVRRGIGFDKKLIAAIACRPNATPEIMKESLKMLTEMGIDGISLGHYDGSHMEHLDAIGEGLKEAGIEIIR